MKQLFLILLIVLSTTIARSCLIPVPAIQNEISKEFYWLGFSIPDENELGSKTNPAASIIESYVHENDSLEMQLVEKICKIKFKRNKPRKDCSNCHQWFTSMSVNKKWVYAKYYSYEPTTLDSASLIQWYKPHFRSELIANATYNEKLSFLSGTFLRCGKIDSAGLSFSIDESPGRSLCIKTTLEFLKCENVTLTSFENVSDYGIILTNRTIISFTPTQLVESFFKTEIEIRK